MVRRLKRGLLLAAVVAAVGAFGSGGAGATSILVVDDDLAQCPNAGYTDIATSIAAASAGDTILVCPGTYAQTTVSTSVSLVGYTGALTTLSKCSDEVGHPADQTTKDSIVAGFIVGANFVSIRGFALTGADNGVLVPGGTSRTTVSRNVIQYNAVGINLNGTNNAADHNCLRDNDAAGSASGTGIYSDQGLKSTMVDQNVFFDNDSAAITLLDTAGSGSLDDVRVTNNVSSQDGDLVSIDGSTNSKISGNTSTASVGSGIYLQAGAFLPNTTLEISNNTLSNGGDEGIFADTASLTNSTVKNNTTKGNFSFGIHVSAGNTDNTIKNNNFKNGGGSNDCEDNSAGGGTLGTANTWKKNSGKTSFPLKLCKK